MCVVPRGTVITRMIFYLLNNIDPEVHNLMFILCQRFGLEQTRRLHIKGTLISENQEHIQLS